jgi:hypothetical protein
VPTLPVSSASYGIDPAGPVITQPVPGGRFSLRNAWMVGLGMNTVVPAGARGQAGQLVAWAASWPERTGPVGTAR